MEKVKLTLKYPVIVEGKYDKIRLASIVSSPIITLNGFSVFNDRQKLDLLRRLGRENGIIILTDSDNAGLFIRTKLKGFLEKCRVINLYIPQIPGKERRKKKPSKEGMLGLEAMDYEVLYNLLKDYKEDVTAKPIDGCDLTPAEFYADGFTGKEDSGQLRKLLSESLNLPKNLNTSGLIEAINLLITRSEYTRAVQAINSNKERDIT